MEQNKHERPSRKIEERIDLVTRIIDACLSDVEVVWFDPDEFPEPGPTGI